MDCPECGCEKITSRMIDDEIPYGEGVDSVIIVAVVPLRKCDSCGFEWTDQEGQKARQDAVEKHLAQAG